MLVDASHKENLFCCLLSLYTRKSFLQRVTEFFHIEIYESFLTCSKKTFIKLFSDVYIIIYINTLYICKIKWMIENNKFSQFLKKKILCPPTSNFVRLVLSLLFDANQKASKNYPTETPTSTYTSLQFFVMACALYNAIIQIFNGYIES